MWRGGGYDDGEAKDEEDENRVTARMNMARRTKLTRKGRGR